MALVAATITVKFTSNYIGCHRVCYRINNSGGYTCINTTCTGSGTQCSVDIPITVDNESCPTVEFDGYAQPCCEDISSLSGRIPFSTTFVPSPACKRYVATCNSVSLLSISVTNGGGGYVVPSNPSVSFSGGGGGSGATATANVGTGFIKTTSISFIGGGSGYTPGTYINVNLLGGSGSGAKGSFTVSGGGVVTLGTVTTVGNGYVTGDVLHPDAAAMGGNITNATFSVITDYGTVISVILNTLGSGYTIAPSVIIAPGISSAATAIANLGYCGLFTVNSCTGTGTPVGDNFIQPGQSIDFCTQGTPPAPADYTIAQDSGNCLCNCTSTTLTATGSQGTVMYKATACNGAIFGGSLSPLASPSSITGCIVTGSLIIKNVGGAVGVVTTHGGC